MGLLKNAGDVKMQEFYFSNTKHCNIYLANAFSLSMLPATDKVFTVEVIELEDWVAQKYLQLPFISAVGHKATAEVISEIVNVNVPVNRINLTLYPGDLLIVFQLLERLPESVVLTPEQMRQIPHKWYLVKICEEEG